MATLVFTGNADAVAQVTHVTPDNVGIGDTFKLICNNKTISYIAEAATVADVVNGLVEALAATTIPEFQEMVGTAGEDDAGNVTHLILTSATPGQPFTVTGSTSNAGDFSILVETLTDGGDGVNEVKTVQCAGIPTGGTFTLTFGGQTTAANAYNIDAATLETNLEALSSIGAGNVAVTLSGSGVSGDPYIWTITFQGSLANTNVAAMTGNGSSLTGAGEITHETVQEGGGTTNEEQTITQPTSDSGTFELNDTTLGGPGYMGPFSTGETAFQFQSDLEGYYGVGNVTVTRITSGGNYVYTIRWLGTWAGTNMDELITVNTTGTVNNTHATVTDGAGTASNEIQHIHILHGPTGGTWDLTTDDGTASGLAYNASASDVQTALEALTAAGDYSVTKSGSGTEADHTVYVVEFTGNLAGLDVGQMTSDPSGLTGAEVLVATTTQGSAGTNEQQKFTIQGGTPTSGTFTLTQDFGSGDETTAAIAYNASAATFRAALEALATPVPGDLSVSGSAGGPWTVTYQGAFAATDVNEATGDGSGLAGVDDQAITVEDITAATGPNFADNVKNYSTGALPANSDTLIFENCDVDLLYNLTALSAVTLAALYVDQSYTGKIGLPVRSGPVGTGYYEYRQLYFAIGATACYIGQGDGIGSGRIKLNFGSVQNTTVIENSGFPLESDVPAILLKGTHASNTLTVNKGSYGVAFFGGETSAIATLLQGYQTDILSDVTGFLGSGCTLTTITKSGGTLEINSNVTTLTNGDGDCTITAGTVTTLAVNGGHVYANSTGTITTASVSGFGILDFSQDDRAKTVTNPIDVYGPNAQLIDPKKVVGSLIVDYNQTGGGAVLNLGNNIRLTRGTPA